MFNSDESVKFVNPQFRGLLKENYDKVPFVNDFIISKCFRNERKCGPFNGVIDKFSLDTESLKQKYKDVKLQLIFLGTEVNDRENMALFHLALQQFIRF